MQNKKNAILERYDISTIRPEIKDEDIKLRRDITDKNRIKSIKAGLHTLHNLENMAANIYRYQITKENSELNRELTAAMLNEMCHIQDFQVKLFEYGFKPSFKSYLYPYVGFVFGKVSRLIGEKAIRSLGIWVETKAVHHYQELLETIEWDDDTRKIIEKNWADEFGHIDRWKNA